MLDKVLVILRLRFISLSFRLASFWNPAFLLRKIKILEWTMGSRTSGIRYWTIKIMIVNPYDQMLFGKFSVQICPMTWPAISTGFSSWKMKSGVITAKWEKNLLLGKYIHKLEEKLGDIEKWSQFIKYQRYFITFAYITLSITHIPERSINITSTLCVI